MQLVGEDDDHAATATPGAGRLLPLPLRFNHGIFFRHEDMKAQMCGLSKSRCPSAFCARMAADPAWSRHSCILGCVFRPELKALGRNASGAIKTTYEWPRLASTSSSIIDYSVRRKSTVFKGVSYWLVDAALLLCPLRPIYHALGLQDRRPFYGLSVLL